MCNGLRKLGEVYSTISDLVCISSNQVRQQRKAVQRLSNHFSIICNTMQESFSEQGNHPWHAVGTQDRRPYSCPNQDPVLYPRCQEGTETIQENNKKLTAADQWSCMVMKMLSQAREIASSMLEFSLHLLSRKVVMPSSTKWSLISKTIQKRRVVCEDEQLQELELDIVELESGIEPLLRTLIQISACLQNTLNL